MILLPDAKYFWSLDINRFLHYCRLKFKMFGYLPSRSWLLHDVCHCDNSYKECRFCLHDLFSYCHHYHSQIAFIRNGLAERWRLFFLWYLIFFIYSLLTFSKLFFWSIIFKKNMLAWMGMKDVYDHELFCPP